MADAKVEAEAEAELNYRRWQYLRTPLIALEGVLAQRNHTPHDPDVPHPDLDMQCKRCQIEAVVNNVLLRILCRMHTADAMVGEVK